MLALTLGTFEGGHFIPSTLAVHFSLKTLYGTAYQKLR